MSGAPSYREPAVASAQDQVCRCRRVTARVARFDESVVSTARDLGATGWQAFRLVALPQSGPAIPLSGTSLERHSIRR
jgi:hypothetical protein